MKKHFTLRDGNVLTYEDIGKGTETVVFLHGWTSNRKIYQEPAKMLSHEARCIIYDQRGHSDSRKAGGTEKDPVTMETLATDLHEIITGLSLAPVTLVGWSMGAGVIMNYVKLFGCEGIKQVILCDMTPKQLNDETWNLGLMRGKYTREKMEMDEGVNFHDLYLKFARKALSQKKFHPDFLLRIAIWRKLMNYDTTVLETLSKSMKLQDNRDVIPTITCPVTYFYADPGTIFLPGLKDWYRENVKSAYREIPFPDSSHMLVSEYPVRFAEEVGKSLAVYHRRRQTN